VLLARELLEGADETVEAVAVRAGFGNASTLRHHFGRWTGATPHAYRRTFPRPGAHAQRLTAPGHARQPG
jgi:transcriptional regulator GlxA family with amidase domain